MEPIDIGPSDRFNILLSSLVFFNSKHPIKITWTLSCVKHPIYFLLCRCVEVDTTPVQSLLIMKIKRTLSNLSIFSQLCPLFHIQFHIEHKGGRGLSAGEIEAVSAGCNLKLHISNVFCELPLWIQIESIASGPSAITYDYSGIVLYPQSNALIASVRQNGIIP